MNPSKFDSYSICHVYFTVVPVSAALLLVVIVIK